MIHIFWWNIKPECKICIFSCNACFFTTVNDQRYSASFFHRNPPHFGWVSDDFMCNNKRKWFVHSWPAFLSSRCQGRGLWEVVKHLPWALFFRTKREERELLLKGGNLKFSLRPRQLIWKGWFSLCLHQKAFCAVGRKLLSWRAFTSQDPCPGHVWQNYHFFATIRGNDWRISNSSSSSDL